jgi:hypothetical protein
MNSMKYSYNTLLIMSKLHCFIKIIICDYYFSITIKLVLKEIDLYIFYYNIIQYFFHMLFWIKISWFIIKL